MATNNTIPEGHRVVTGQEGVTGTISVPIGSDADINLKNQEEDVITSGSLEDTSGLDLDFESTQETTEFPTETLDTPDLTLGPIGAETDALTNELMGLNAETLGESEFRGGLEEDAGLVNVGTDAAGNPIIQTEASKELTAQLNALIAESTAAPLKVEQDFAGSGGTPTKTGLAIHTKARRREIAIEALSVKSLLEAERGNITFALGLIDRAVAQKYDPIKEAIAVKTRNLELLLTSPALSIEQANMAQAQLDAQANQAAAVAKAEAEETAIKGYAARAAQNGASAAEAQAIGNAKTEEEALALANKFLVDPLSKIELANAKLDNELKQIELGQKALESYYFNLYGGMTKAEYLKDQQEEQEAIDAAAGEIEKAELQAEAIGKKLGLLNSIYDPKTGVAAKGLDTVVGSTFLTRGQARQKKGVLGKTVSHIKHIATFGLTSGVLDELSGADNVVNMTEQFISQEFLQSLIDVKAQGATFGALQKAEQDALTSAATKIGDARIREGNLETSKVIGYDMTEKDFKAEIALIQFYANLAYERAIGKTFSPDEDKKLDAYETHSNSTEAANFNPAAYF